MSCATCISQAPLGKITSAKYCAALYQTTGVEPAHTTLPPWNALSPSLMEKISPDHISPTLSRLRSTTSSLSLILLFNTDTEAKEAFLVRETNLKSELAECKAAAATSSSGSSHSSCAQCGILGKNDPGHFSRRLKADLAACKAGWAAVGDGTTCRSYAHDGGSPGTSLLYYKHIRELEPAGNFKVEGAWRSWDKGC